MGVLQIQQGRKEYWIDIPGVGSLVTKTWGIDSLLYECMCLVLACLKQRRPCWQLKARDRILITPLALIPGAQDDGCKFNADIPFSHQGFSQGAIIRDLCDVNPTKHACTNSTQINVWCLSIGWSWEQQGRSYGLHTTGHCRGRCIFYDVANPFSYKKQVVYKWPVWSTWRTLIDRFTALQIQPWSAV